MLSENAQGATKVDGNFEIDSIRLCGTLLSKVKDKGKKHLL
jgi:hypothetical protein